MHCLTSNASLLFAKVLHARHQPAFDRQLLTLEVILLCFCTAKGAPLQLFFSEDVYEQFKTSSSQGDLVKVV